MKKLVKKIFSPPSLRLNATAFLEVVLIMSVLLVVLFYFSRKTLRQEAMWDAEQTLETTVQKVDNVLLSVEQSTGNVYWDMMAHINEPDRIETYCRHLVACNKNIMGCAIGFEPGFFPGHEQFLKYVHRRQYDSDELEAMHDAYKGPYTKQRWYAEAMASGASKWIDARKDSLSDGGSVITYCLPVYAPLRGETTDTLAERNRIGVIAVDVSVNLLSEIVLANKPSPNSFSLVLGNDGSFIVHPDPDVLVNHTLATMKEAGADPAMIEAGEAMIAGEAGNRAFRLRGEDYHLFYKPFVRSEVPGRSLAELDWSIGVVYPDDDIFGDYNNMLYQVLKVAFIGLLVFFVLCRFITRGQLKPLRSLTESAQRIAEGDYSEKIPQTKRSDEIGQLHRHFVQMQQSLAARVSELEQLNTTLEERRETLRKTYEQTQEDGRVKATFLRRMTNQMIAPTEAINHSVLNLCNNYQSISLKEANEEMNTIKQQSKTTLELLNKILNREGTHHAAATSANSREFSLSNSANSASDSATGMSDSAPTKSLSKKLSRTLMWLAIPILALALSVYYRHTQSLIHEEAQERTTSILNTTVQRIIGYMNAIENAGKSNVWLLEENFDPESIEAISRRIVWLNRSVLSCSVSAEPDVFPQTGRHFSVYSVREGDSIITVRESDFDYFDKVWYKTALHSGRPSWIDPFSDFNEGTINYNDAVASFCIPLRPTTDSLRQIAGVLSTDFSFNRLAERIKATEHPYPSAYYMLLGADGRYLIHPNTNLLFKKTIFSDTDPVEHADVMALGQEMNAGHQGTMHVILNNQLCHVTYTPLPGTHASLALVCPDDEILADYRYLGYLMIGLMIVGLLLIRWLTYRVVKQNIKPVNQLLEVTKKITEGNYDVVIPRSNRKDAIAQLQNGFAEMQQHILTHVKSIDHTTEEIKMQNAELEEALVEAEEAAKNKDAFIQKVLEHVNTPINIIEGLTNVLGSGLASRGKNSDLDNIARTMKHNANILHRTMLMLFDLSETGAADGSLYKRTDEVACNQLAQECIDYTQNLFHTEIRLETEVPDSLCIQTNHLYLMRTVRELLYNAAKYSDGQHIVMRVTQTEATVRFTVEDKGPGLPKEYEELLTQPFTKGNEGSEGLGLGLPLSKRHAIGLGGDLTYDPNYQEGCRFVVEMPKLQH